MTDPPTAPQTPPETSTRAFIKLGWPLFIANLAVVGNGTIDNACQGVCGFALRGYKNTFWRW